MPHLPPVAPCDFLVFGGTGDLAMRKLLPALYLRDRDGQLADATRIFSISRAGLDEAGFRDKVDAELQRHVGGSPDAVRARFLGRLHHVSLDVMDETDWSALTTAVGERPAPVRVFYLACAPRLFGPISARAAANGLVDATSRVVLEKPIGHDLDSARAINDEVGAVFTEEQIFRIDHYLGKETVQNLLVLRFANALLEPLWNAGHIDHVQISVAESIGVGGRANYYDGSGALRDMVQNHLLQLLCLVAMEPPATLDREAVRDEKLKVLQSLRPLAGPAAIRQTVRGQYGAGLVDGEAVPGYLDRARRREPRRDVRRAEGRGRQLALGRGAVLPALRQAAGRASLGDRRAVPAGAALGVSRRPRRDGHAEPARAAAAAGRGRAPAPGGQAPAAASGCTRPR